MSTSAVFKALVSSMLAHELEHLFEQATGLPVELVPSGEPAWLFRFQQRGNPLCSLMAQFPGSCNSCQQVHTELQRRLTASLVPEVIDCFAGLSEFAVPVVVGGEHVATLLGGQILQSKPTREQFDRVVEQLHEPGALRKLARIEDAFFQTPVISRKQFQASLRLLKIFARFLAEDANRDLLAAHTHDGACITSAKNFILTHADEPLSLGTVAEHVHLSPNYFSKFFKKVTGVRFSEYLARVRVEKAKDLISNQQLSINAVASQAGFGSLSQFNRAFHRFTGYSPKEYRLSLRQGSSF
jgi:AraC-like DNA-binding protein